MAKRVEFQVGDEVAVIGHDGAAWCLRTIRCYSERRGEWSTTGDAGREPTRWSKTGLVRDDRFGDQRIVPATNEHRRAIRVRGLLSKAQSRATWDAATPEQIEAIAKIMGWD